MVVNRRSNDAEILWVPPQSDTDARVPTAEELAASARLTTQSLWRSREMVRPSGVLNRPNFTASGKNITIPGGLQVWAAKHPAIATLSNSHTLSLPLLPDTVASVSRYDRIYLACFCAEVDDDIDPAIRMQFTWRDQSDALQSVTKENTRRLRSFWAFVWAPGPTTVQSVLAALNTANGPALTVETQSVAGFSLGSGLRIWPQDTNLAQGKTYRLLEESLELIELLRVWRVQNTNQQGYFWGRTGEGSFDAAFHLQPSYRYVGADWQNWPGRARDTLWRLMTGRTVLDTPTLDRSVQNLLNGQVGTNLNAPGVATASPNGSTALANEQRIAFTNAAIASTLFCLPQPAGDDGSGNATATVNFAGNSPSGSAFSSSGHKIYGPTGADISAEGAFSGGGGTGALSWVASGGASVVPGDTVYLVPSISYPSGSGFPVAGDIESVYLGSTALASTNVRDVATNPLTSYVNPSGGGNYLVMMDKGRAALAYILRKYTVTADGSGRVAIPGAARGLIAWISGPSAPTEHQGVPVVSGLTAGASYDILVYHAPPGSEQWQFQFRAARYAGTGELGWLDGARVAGAPIAIAHSQGGGNPASNSAGDIQHHPVAFRLPSNTASGAVRSHQLAAKLQFSGEADPGDLTFREIFPPYGQSGLAQLQTGQTISTTVAAEAQGQGIAIRLAAGGIPLGTAKIKLAENHRYQLVVAVPVEKAGEVRLLVTTVNGGDPGQQNAIAYDSDAPHWAGIDTFKLF